MVQRIFDFFSVRLNFISPNEHQMQYFHEWRQPQVKIQALVFMSEIKFLHYTEKVKFSVSFMLLFTIIQLLPALRLSRQKTNFFPSHSTSVWSCSVCLGSIILVKTQFCSQKMRPNSIQSNKTLEICGEKMPQSVIIRLMSRAEKVLHQRFHHGTLTPSP